MVKKTGENIAEYYYYMLRKSTNPGRDLTAMYSEIFGIQVNRSHIIMINKMIKLYGREDVFFAILTLTEISKVNHNASLYPLMSAILKKRLEKKYKGTELSRAVDMSSYINKIDKALTKQSNKNLVIPEGLDD